MLQIVDGVEASETTALDRLGHRVVAPTCSTGLHLGHAELRLQEEVEAAVGQQQRVLEDPGEHGKEQMEPLSSVSNYLFVRKHMTRQFVEPRDSRVLFCFCGGVLKFTY